MHHHPDTLAAVVLDAHRRRGAGTSPHPRTAPRSGAARAKIGALLIDAGERLAASARPARPARPAHPARPARPLAR